ncbi:MAG: polysaccharide biosynthesis tyrosine autokinase [Clostridia bacterium]|nr:polysaccharide biosynthesis tyrosine autokinase [Clostridia bacterium]
MRVMKEEGGATLIDLKALIENFIIVFKRLWWLAVVFALIIGTLLPVISKVNYTPVYRAYCSFSVKVKNNSNTSDLNSLYGIYYDKDLATQLESTFSYILSSDLLTDAIKEDLGAKFLSNNITAKCIPGSNLFELNTYAATPQEAGQLLESVMVIFEETARYVIGDLDVDLVEETVIMDTPTTKVNLVKDAVLGAGIGIALAMALFAVLSLVHNTVQNPGDLEDHLNMPWLGVVPVADLKKNDENSIVHNNNDVAENIHGIARKLDNMMKKDGLKVLLVTSTAPEEGKSTLSLALAEVMESWGRKTAIIDGDLRNPTLYRRVGLKKKTLPLEKVIKGEVSPENVIFKVTKSGVSFVGNSIPVEDPTVLINSNEMRDFITTLSSQVDCLIIDTPPCETMTDVALYQEYSDGIIYVVRQDYVPISTIINAVESLGQSDGKILGYILNGARETVEGYGKYSYGKYSYGKYGSGYGYYGRYSSYGKYGYYGKYSKYARSRYGDTVNE